MKRAQTRAGSEWDAAREYGFDMDQIERNLELTPAERIRRHCRALALALELRAAAEKRRG